LYSIAIASLISGLVSSFDFSGSDRVRFYPTSVDGYRVINPSQLSVSFVVTNDGPSPVEPSCTVKSADPTGTYTGFHTAVEESIAPGKSQRLVAQVTISRAGAKYVTDVTAECQTTE
jgi:hypothetical protein